MTSQIAMGRAGAFGAVTWERIFFVLALLFVLWLGQGVQQYAQQGELRWQRDRHAGMVLADTAMPESLTVLWCQRDTDFIRQNLNSVGEARCRSDVWKFVWSWLKNAPEVHGGAVAEPRRVLQLWQREVALRTQQWRLRWSAQDAAQIKAVMVAEAQTVTDTSSAPSLGTGQATVSLEQELPVEVVRLQALSNERLMQWDQWVKDSIEPLIQSPITEIQAEALWAVAQSLEGSGSDVVARTVRQAIKANDYATRAGYLQNLMTHLPWLLTGHWLLTVMVTYWLRARVRPLQQLNGLIFIAMISWLGVSALGVAPSLFKYPVLMIILGLWMVLSWVTAHFYAHALPAPISAEPVNSSWLPGWWLFTATGCLLLLDQSLHFHERLRFLALEQWWAWFVSVLLLPLAAWAAPWLLGGVRWLGYALWGHRSYGGIALRWLVGALLVLGFHMAHRLNIPQHVTGELLKAVFLVALCGWCVWKMPLAAQLWHAGHARNSVRYLMGAVTLMVLVAVAAFATSDKGPLLVMALLMAVLLATVLGWTGGMGLLVLGFGTIFLIGVDLDVVGERLQAWQDPFTADRDDMARLMWFQSEAARFAWGFGVGQVPWCGSSRLDVCHGLPLQLQSDYTFTAIMGWWGPWGAWSWLLLFSAYAYHALMYCARRSPSVLTPGMLLQPGSVKEALAMHLLFLFAVLMLMQTWITAAGNLGWLPLTGLTWPLLSYGKSSLWVSTFFAGAWGMRRLHA